MFETKLIPEARPIAILKKVFVGVVIALLVIGAVSSYRAYVQVKSLQINASQILRAGSKVDLSLVSSGRTTVEVNVELIQNSHSQTILTMQLKGNGLGCVGPRTKSAGERGVRRGGQGNEFRPGSAALR